MAPYNNNNKHNNIVLQSVNNNNNTKTTGQVSEVVNNKSREVMAGLSHGNGGMFDTLKVALLWKTFFVHFCGKGFYQVESLAGSSGACVS